ncbi:MAG: hypothetical protein Q9M91_04550 [Candidatus Dojkabacteria bacterium]|nr:hypothetical protein [Candidatus Dojkabacteria bacterium]
MAIIHINSDFREGLEPNDWILGIFDGVNANEAGLIVAKAEVGKGDIKEKWAYIRTHNKEGWIREDDLAMKEKDEIDFDPLRPAKNQERLGENFGVVVEIGLKYDPIQKRLVSVDPFKTNDKLKNDQIDKIVAGGMLEDIGDGIAEKGERSLLSLGDPIKIISEVEEDFLVELANGKQYLLDKNYLNRGYLEKTPENFRMMLEKAIGNPYSWGDGDGINFDCSGLTERVQKAFGIASGAGSDAQTLETI